MGKKIMLVDDAAFMRMTIKNTLTKAGYTELVEAGDGQQAVETYDKEHPDLVIMDITMPNMDGIQALQAIKDKDAGAKVVMCFPQFKPGVRGKDAACNVQGQAGLAGQERIRIISTIVLNPLINITGQL